MACIPMHALVQEGSAMSSTPSAARPARHERSARSEAAGFQALDTAHAAALSMLEQFAQLVEQLAGPGLDDTARRHAHEVLRYFDGPGRHHHEDEERLVFPALLSCGDDGLVAQVRRLQQDHLWLEQDWRELQPHLQAVAEGMNGYDLPLLQAALPVFAALYQDHISLEETLVYPAARRVLHRQREARHARLAASAQP